MKKIGMALIGLLAVIPLAQALTEDTSWNLAVGGPDPDVALGAATTHDGDTYVVGYGTNLATASSARDCVIRKYDSTGVEYTGGTLTLGWPKIWDAGLGKDEVCTSVAIGANGKHVYVGGYITNLYGSTGHDAMVFKYDWAGIPQSAWSGTSTGSFDDEVRSMVYDTGSDDLVIAGTWNDYAGGGTGIDGFVKRLDMPNGVVPTTVWTSYFPGWSNFAAEFNGVDIYTNPPAKVWVVGSADRMVGGPLGPNTGLDRIMARYDFATGAFQNSQFEDGPNSLDDVATSVSVDQSTGWAYVAGWGTDLTISGSAKDTWVSRWTSNGIFQDEWQHNGNGDELVLGVAARQDGSGCVSVGELYNAVQGQEMRITDHNFQLNTSLIDDQTFDDYQLDDALEHVHIVPSGVLAGEIFAVGRGYRPGSEENWRIRKFNP